MLLAAARRAAAPRRARSRPLRADRGTAHRRRGRRRGPAARSVSGRAHCRPVALAGPAADSRRPRARLDGGRAKASLDGHAGLVVDVTCRRRAGDARQPKRCRSPSSTTTTDIVVVDKPAGMVVHPAAGHARGTLVNALLHHVADLSGIGGARAARASCTGSIAARRASWSSPSTIARTARCRGSFTIATSARNTSRSCGARRKARARIDRADRPRSAAPAEDVEPRARRARTAVTTHRRRSSRSAASRSCA